MYILHTVLYTFLNVLTRRICLKKTRAYLVCIISIFFVISVCDLGGDIVWKNTMLVTLEG